MHPTEQLLEALNYIGHMSLECAYLPGRFSSLLFLDGREIGPDYRTLLDSGYRRHGTRFYRPDCPDCLECKVLRIPLETFVPSRNQKRVLRKGREVFRHEIGPTEFSPGRLEMYQRYLDFQHDKTEDDMDERSYREFFVDSVLGVDTFELRLFKDDRPAGIGILDRVGDALSSVYFFFEPEFAEYSPGTYTMLLETEIAREMKLNYYYPGYFIKGCKTMEYKLRLRPAQLKDPMADAEWRDIARGDST